MKRADSDEHNGRADGAAPAAHATSEQSPRPLTVAQSTNLNDCAEEHDDDEKDDDDAADGVSTGSSASSRSASSQTQHTTRHGKSARTLCGVTVDFLQQWADGQTDEALNGPMVRLRDCLPALSHEDLVPATCLVIHAWEEPVCDVLKALSGDKRLKHEGLYLFCLQPAAMRTVDAAVSAIAQLSKACVVMTLFAQAKPLEQAWCTFEIALFASNAQADLMLCVPPQEHLMLVNRMKRSRGMDRLLPQLIDNCDLGVSWLTETPTAALALALQQRDVDTRVLRQTLIVQVCHALLKLNAELTSTDVAVVLRRMSSCLIERDCMEEAVVVSERVIGTELPDVAALTEDELCDAAFNYTTLSDAYVSAAREATAALRVACEAHSRLIVEYQHKAKVHTTCSLFIRLAQALIELREFAEAEHMVQRALDNAEATNNNSLVVNALNVWREIAMHVGNAGHAVELQRRAFETTCMMRGRASREAMLQLGGLASLLLYMNDIAGAEACFETVMAHRAVDNLERVQILDHLARAAKHAGLEDKALAYKVRARKELHARVMAEMNESTLLRLNEYLQTQQLPVAVQADLLWEAGHKLIALNCVTEACDRLEEAYTALSQHLGVSHPLCMSDLLDLVTLMYRSGEYDRLVDFVDLKVTPELCPDICKVIELKGMAYDALGLADDAENEFGKVWAWHYGHGHRVECAAIAKRAAETMLRYAAQKRQPAQRGERLIEAVQWFRQALKVTPEDTVARVRLCEALFLCGKEDDIEAELRLDELAVHAPPGVHVAALKLMIRARVHQARAPEAAEHCRQAMSLLVEFGASELDRAAFAVEVFVPTLLLLDDVDLIDCLDVTENALNVMQAHYGRVLTHPNGVHCLIAQGSVWARMGELEQAQSAFYRAVVLAKAIFSDSAYHPLTLRALKGLQGVWAEQGRIDQAEGVGDDGQAGTESGVSEDEDDGDTSDSNLSAITDDDESTIGSSVGSSVHSLGLSSR